MKIFVIRHNGTIHQKDKLFYIGGEGRPFSLKGYYIFAKGIVITNRCW